MLILVGIVYIDYYIYPNLLYIYIYYHSIANRIDMLVVENNNYLIVDHRLVLVYNCMYFDLDLHLILVDIFYIDYSILFNLFYIYHYFHHFLMLHMHFLF